VHPALESATFPGRAQLYTLFILAVGIVIGWNLP